MASITDLLDWNQPSLYYALGSIFFNPVFWNIVARTGTAFVTNILHSRPIEYRSHALTKLAGGNAYLGCYSLAIVIFSLGIFRDFLYKTALEHQPTSSILEHGEFKILSILLFITGNTLVLSSMWALGITGTYLGDYFGILMKKRVTSFPFNVTDNPMYYGSTLTFLATALWYASPAGIFLTIIVFALYLVALRFEGPFTAMIYSKRDEMLSTKEKNI
ncbi:phospholipid methyltransferase-domain-containing protein [Endogone sp. FLAS-F59071]|nr:phospholipid methyltransferase-domain-containing protein [Endogone sp. FLAS-F59071]|eukprot:RUS19976.1 phospholipid methyltransferase-domain-containing protein [Endogone sp. FLAS-F59071]